MLQKLSFMPSTADIVITQAKVFTADPVQPTADAVAVRGRQIVFVGSTAAAKAWCGSTTRVIDAQQCTLMPGFIDSHFHLLWGSLKLRDLQVGHAQSYEQLAIAAQQFAAERPNQLWVVGHGLRYNLGPGRRGLTRHDLDTLIPDRPFILFAYDVHTVWANTEALRRANLLQNGQIVAPNSEIVLGSDGLANGELRESGAYEPILDLIPPLNEADRRELLHQGLANIAQMGITSVHNMDGRDNQATLYAGLEDAGELTLRVYLPYDVTPETPPAALREAAALRQAHQSDMVRAGCVKFFMDGVIESYTGLLVEDYAGQPGNIGGANFSAEQFTALATEADRLGLQIFVHAVGDGAVRRTLDGFAAAQKTNGLRDSRHRIEHIELIHPDDLPRFAELGVIASMQPLHAPLTMADPDIWPARVGQERWGRSFAWQTLREAGARLAFGSDWPVADFNPLAGVHAALNRQPWAPGQPEQRQTLADTLLAYTRDAAYAEFQEARKGQVRVGMLADLVLLSEDIFAVPPQEVNRVQPVLTMGDGRIVFEK
jgi:hypothetical protein